MHEESSSSAETRRDCAVVIGAGAAGLCAARVLSDHFRRVLILERDQLEDAPGPRRGVPHGQHLHGLLAAGVRALESLFPGFVRQAAERGGHVVDVGTFATWYADGVQLPQLETGMNGLLLTRPLLDSLLRKLLASHQNVSVADGVQVVGLEGSAWKVTGVRVRSGQPGPRADGSASTPGEHTIEADLVVDASGRMALLPGWLARFGLPPPEQEMVSIELTYTTCLIRRKPHHLGGRLGFVYPPTAPGLRAGAALAVEGDRYIVTLMGYLGERAPRTFAGMVEYARSLPVPELYELLRDSEPLSEPIEMRDPKSTRRRYERLKHWPEGLVALGDSLCSINPTQAHGITLAALQAQVLGRELGGGPRGLAQRFFAEVTPLIDVPWSLVSGGDFEFEGMEGSAPRPPPAIRTYFKRVLRAALIDRHVALAVYRVMHLVDPPSVLFTPEVMAAVLASDPTLAATLTLTPDGGRAG